MIFLVTCYPHITLFSPGGVPRILDDPVVSFLAVCAVTNNERSVIQYFRAVFVGVLINALSVKLKLIRRSVDANRHQAHSSHGVCERVFVSFRYIYEICDNGTSSVFPILTTLTALQI